MQIINLKDTHLDLPPCVASIGFFDGVHRGHQHLIHSLMQHAKEAEMASMVITFGKHPRQVVQPDFVPQLLTTHEEKLRLLAATGVDYCVVLPFDKEMAAMSAQIFMQKVLKERLNVAQLLIGYDNRFGHNRSEGFSDYCRYGTEMGIEVHEATGYEEGGVRMSSSLIRQSLAQGDVRMAHRCLGYAYSLSGRVVKGFEEGRKLGYPTANMSMDDIQQIIPAKGIYIVEVEVEDFAQRMVGMTCIGTRPTYGGVHLTVETHILDFSNDIYDKEITIRFVDRIRDELKFDSVEALKEKMREDETITRARVMSW